MNSHGATLRKRTSLAQHDPGNLIDHVISFILNVRRKFDTKEYAMSNVIAMDSGKRDVKRMNEGRDLSRKCAIRSSTNDWMNESLTVEWVQYVEGRFFFSPRFLVWDACKCHMTNEVKDALRRYSVGTCWVHKIHTGS